MANRPVRTDPPRGKEMDIETIVSNIDPRPPYDVVYPARNLGERSFIAYDGEPNPHRNQPGELED